MQDNQGGGDDSGNDGHNRHSGGHPDPYANPAPAPPNRRTFEVPDDKLDDDKYFERSGPVFDRLGRPKYPSDYKWSDDDPSEPLTNDDRGYRDHMARVFHKSGATQRQVRAYEKAQIAYVKAQRDAQAATRADAARLARSELGREWGDQFQSRTEKANQAFRAYGGSDSKALLGLVLEDGTPLKDNAAFLRMLARVSETMPEGVAKASTPDGAKAEIERIQKEALRKGLDPTSQHWPHAELDELCKRAYSTKRIDQSLRRGNEE